MRRIILAAMLTGLLVTACKSGEEPPVPVEQARPLLTHATGQLSYSPCGMWMAYTAAADVWIRPTDGSGKPINVTGIVPAKPLPEGAPTPAEPTPVQIAQGPQAGWEYDPVWSPDGLMFAFAATRQDANDQSPDTDTDIWVLRFPERRWREVMEKNVRLGGTTDVDEEGADGLFRDVCPPAPEDAEGKPKAETPEELEARLSNCTRYLTLPGTYVQITSDDGAETQPAWIPGGREISFRSSKGSLWAATLPADLVPPPGEGGCPMHRGGMGAPPAEGGCGCKHGEGGGPHGEGGCPMHGGGAGAPPAEGGCGCRHGEGGGPHGEGGCPMHGGGAGAPPAEGGCGCKQGGGSPSAGDAPSAPHAGCPHMQQMNAGNPAAAVSSVEPPPPPAPAVP